MSPRSFSSTSATASGKSKESFGSISERTGGWSRSPITSTARGFSRQGTSLCGDRLTDTGGPGLRRSETAQPKFSGVCQLSFVKNASDDESPRFQRFRRLGFGGSADRNLWHATVCYVPVTSRAWISLCPLSPICSIAKTLISLGLRSDVFLARDSRQSTLFPVFRVFEAVSHA